MAEVRGQERFVYEQVLHIVEDHLLTTLGWDGVDLGHLPWGALTALTFVDRPPDVKPGPVEPNTIAFSEGALPEPLDIELGAEHGGLWAQEHTFFVDIYGESAGMAKAIAGDVSAIFRGRLGVPRYHVLDGLVGPLVGHYLHFEDIEISFPAVGAAAKTHWTVVKATCVHEFNS